MRPRIALFQHHPHCSIECCNGVVKALGSKYNIQIFTEDMVSPETFTGIDLIVFPGGIGDSDKYYNLFTRRKANVIADFVAQGGHYLGICMGAYWAGHHYFDILDSVKCLQYIKQPTADIKRSYGTVVPVTWNNSNQNMFFYDGATFEGDASKYETYASYANGNPAAIIQGRIGLIGPHPESEEFWYQSPYQYINSYWHKGLHHQLLQEFVDTLLTRR